MSPPVPRSVFLDSVPIVGIASFWTLLASLGSGSLVGTGAKIAGIGMALAYAVVSGAESFSRTRPVTSDTDPVAGRVGRAVGYRAEWTATALREIAPPVPTPLTRTQFDGESVIRVNALALLASGPWFAAAVLFATLREPLRETPLLPGLASLADGLAFVFTVTAVITVVLYATRLCVTSLDTERWQYRIESAADVSSADD